jgi:hypothetical protein
MKASAVHCTAVVVAEGSVNFFLLRLGQEPVPGDSCQLTQEKRSIGGNKGKQARATVIARNMDESESRIIRPPA